MEPYVYNSINEVPKTWRSYKSALLSLNQINEIMKDAYENAKEENLPDYGGAKQRFAETHEIVEGFWVRKEPEE
jgi:hypothetical protein